MEATNPASFDVDPSEGELELEGVVEKTVMESRSMNGPVFG